MSILVRAAAQHLLAAARAPVARDIVQDVRACLPGVEVRRARSRLPQARGGEGRLVGRRAARVLGQRWPDEGEPAVMVISESWSAQSFLMTC